MIARALRSARLRNPVLRCNTTDLGVLYLAQHCRDLITSIKLSKEATDASLFALVCYCKGITDINLSSCKLITILGLRALAENCNAITTIDLDSCYDVDDNGLLALAVNCNGITNINLNLEDCGLITNKSLRALAEYCKDIDWIDLNGCT